MILLKATNENWGLRSVEDWNRNEFLLDRSGKLRIKVYYRYPVIDTSVNVSAEDMTSIKDNLGKIISNPPGMIPEACDGDAWSFKAYDDNGMLIFEWNLNYIYDVDSLENIGRILDSYIPDYEEPA